MLLRNYLSKFKAREFRSSHSAVEVSAIRGGEFEGLQDEGREFIRNGSGYLLGDTTACSPRHIPSKNRVAYRSPAICGLLKGAVVFDFPGRWIHSHQLLSQHAPGDSHSCVFFHSCAPLRQGDQTCVQHKSHNCLLQDVTQSCSH